MVKCKSFVGLLSALIGIFQNTSLNQPAPFPPRDQHKNSMSQKNPSYGPFLIEHSSCLFWGHFEDIQLNIFPAGIYSLKVNNFKKLLWKTCGDLCRKVEVLQLEAFFRKEDFTANILGCFYISGRRLWTFLSFFNFKELA